jgi:hypothetical protein
MVGIAGAFKIIEWASLSKGVLKEGEIAPGLVAVKAETGSASTSPSQLTRTQESSLDGLELLSAVRGIGWKFGTGSHVHIPPEWRDTSNRMRWVVQTLLSTFAFFLVTDFFESSLKAFPGIGTAKGGSMFVFGRNVWEKYAISTLIEILTGYGIIAGTFVSLFSCQQPLRGLLWLCRLLNRLSDAVVILCRHTAPRTIRLAAPFPSALVRTFAP